MKKTHFIALTVAIVFFSSCNNTGTGNNSIPKTDSTAKTESKAERNKKVVMSSMDGVNAHDAEKVFKDCTADYVEYSDGIEAPRTNVDSLKNALAGYFANFTDLKFEHAAYFADGNSVIVDSDFTITPKNEKGSTKATKSAKFKDADIFTLDDNGKITSHRSIYPTSAINKQLDMEMP
jgi:predicted ester cyclase